MAVTMDFALARQNMIDGQVRPNGVIEAKLVEVMEQVPRELFVPANRRSVAYIDEDLPLGSNRYLPEPVVTGRLVQALKIAPSDVVLEIGAGTGYTTAILSKLAATVVAVESDEALSARAQETLAELDIDNVVMVNQDYTQGYADQAPYDAILINGSVAECPENIVSQLAEDGRLVCVVRDERSMGRITLVQRVRGVTSEIELYDAGTPMLPGFEPAAAFEF